MLDYVRLKVVARRGLLARDREAPNVPTQRAMSGAPTSSSEAGVVASKMLRSTR